MLHGVLTSLGNDHDLDIHDIYSRTKHNAILVPHPWNNSRHGWVIHCLVHCRRSDTRCHRILVAMDVSARQLVTLGSGVCTLRSCNDMRSADSITVDLLLST